MQMYFHDMYRTTLRVLCCFALLLVWPSLLLSFHPSASLINLYILYIQLTIVDVCLAVFSCVVAGAEAHVSLSSRKRFTHTTVLTRHQRRTDVCMGRRGRRGRRGREGGEGGRRGREGGRGGRGVREEREEGEREGGEGERRGRKEREREEREGGWEEREGGEGGRRGREKDMGGKG